MTNQAEAKRQSEQVTGLSNVAYDLIATLENKLKGIAAIEQYKSDCSDANDSECSSLLQEIQREDRQHVEKLRRMVKERL